MTQTQNLMRILFFICLLSTFLSNVYGQDLSNIREQKPVVLKGSLSVSAVANSISSKDSLMVRRRRPPFSYYLAGNPTLSLYGIDIPVSFLFSNFQRSFRQPFNKFGLSPTYKSIKFHLGHRNIRFSPYTLNGHTFLGVGIETNPGILRLGAVYGRFQKAIEEDSTFTYQENLTRPPKPSFRRNAYAVKLGIGSDQTFLDFIYLKGKDVLGSIKSIEEKRVITPSENAVFGVSAKVGFTENISWKIDIGASAYTRDIRQDTLTIEGGDLNGTISKILQPRLTSQGFFAGETSLGYKSKHFNIEGKYKRIDPGYRTMGAYYFQTDLAQYLLGLGFSNLKNTFRFRGQFGVQHDNIRNNKLNQTNRTISSAFLTVQPSQSFGFDFQFSNFGVAQKPGLVSISDTTRLRNINQNIVLTPRILIPGKSTTQLITAIGTYSVLNDENDFTKNITEVKSLSTHLNYNLTHQPSGFSFMAGWNRVSSTLSIGTTVASGFMGGVGKSFAKNKLRIRANYLHNTNRFEEMDNGSTSRLSAYLQFVPSRMNRFKIDIYQLKNNSLNSQVSRSFTENTVRLTYTYLFDTSKTNAK